MSDIERAMPQLVPKEKGGPSQSRPSRFQITKFRRLELVTQAEADLVARCIALARFTVTRLEVINSAY